MFADDLREAALKITEAFESLAEAFRALSSASEEAEETPLKKVPQTKKRPPKKLNTSYHCNMKPQRNLPYQRRSY